MKRGLGGQHFEGAYREQTWYAELEKNSDISYRLRILGLHLTGIVSSAINVHVHTGIKHDTRESDANLTILYSHWNIRLILHDSLANRYRCLKRYRQEPWKANTVLSDEPDTKLRLWKCILLWT